MLLKYCSLCSAITITSVATSSANILSWVTNRRASPSYFHFRYSCSQTMAFTSKWLVGSSSMRKAGERTSAQANPTRLLHPPDNEPSLAFSFPFLNPKPFSSIIECSSNT
mmetsp:Transcript_13554/g.25960  ORF Transcript_13554/g.25960 Transcript_13554/m.25960 type:complete len:110 (-) Transcript_13554:543-872(-)